MEKTMCVASERTGMSGENGGQTTAEAAAPDRVLGVVADGEPRTAAEIGEAVGSPPAALAETLEHLRERGVLATKTVGAADVRIWYATGEAGPATDGDDGPEDLEVLVAEMDVPGTSEMMRSWRRDAIRETAEFLADRRRATPAEIRESVFEAHPAGYDDPYVWWETVRPRLAELPGVEPPGEDDDVWRYVAHR